MKLTVVIHKYSDSILYGGRWVSELPKDIDISMIGQFSDIQYRGESSDGIIDTNYFSPEDFGKEEWNDDDDTTDDYKEVEIEIEINAYVVKYWNFIPDYSLCGHKGGYCEWFSEFNTQEEALVFIAELSSKYRGELLNSED